MKKFSRFCIRQKKREGVAGWKRLLKRAGLNLRFGVAR